MEQATGIPASSAGVKFHLLAVSRAAASSSGSLELRTRAEATFPFASTTRRTVTRPSTFFLNASEG